MDYDVIIVGGGKAIPQGFGDLKRGRRSSQIETDNKLETSIRGLFVAGDGPGVAGNIVSAAATGLIPAKQVLAVRSDMDQN
ncbi:MAG: hypothetical protein RBQ72_07385 [Desulfobacterium sp.]|jgi:uncharacterized FAD-dependent dehydrogenase|nr:hypothetical protein [Desulfobacterium sp.]